MPSRPSGRHGSGCQGVAPGACSKPADAEEPKQADVTPPAPVHVEKPEPPDQISAKVADATAKAAGQVDKSVVVTPKATVRAPGTPKAPGRDPEVLMTCFGAIADEFCGMVVYRDSQGFEATADLLRKLDERQLSQLIEAARRAPEFRTFQKYNSANPPDDAPQYAAMFGVGTDEERLENVISFRLWQTACKRVVECREQLLERAKVKIEPVEEPMPRGKSKALGSGHATIQKKTHDFAPTAEPDASLVPAQKLAGAVPLPQAAPVQKERAPETPSAADASSPGAKSEQPAGGLNWEQAQFLIRALQQAADGGEKNQVAGDGALKLVTQALQAALQPSTATRPSEGAGCAEQTPAPSTPQVEAPAVPEQIAMPPPAVPPPKPSALVQMPPPPVPPPKPSLPLVVNSSTHPNEYANLRRFVEKNVHCHELATQWEPGPR